MTYAMIPLPPHMGAFFLAVPSQIGSTDEEVAAVAGCQGCERAIDIENQMRNLALRLLYQIPPTCARH